MMWAYPQWNVWGNGEAPQRRTSSEELVLARVRHPSFSSDLAEQLVQAMSSRQLRRLWSMSNRLMERELENDVRFRVVVLREQLLDEIDRRNEVTRNPRRR
jgi:hypothetical protein